MTHSFPTRRSADLRVKNARAAQSQLRVIETVVRAALFDNPDAVARVMKVANDKVRTHLQAGRQFQAAKVRDTSVRAVEPSGRHRQEPGKERAPLQRRSEGRRVGKECVRTCRPRWSRAH